jgi:hypothetical protein
LCINVIARIDLRPRLSSRYGRVLPANLTSGGRISHHDPAFGTGELQ